MMGAVTVSDMVTDGQFSSKNRKDIGTYGPSRSSNFGRVLKGVSVLVLLVLVFSYATRMFTGSSLVSKNEEGQFWRVESLRETEMVINGHGHTRESSSLKRNKTVPLSQSHSVETRKQNIVQGTGPVHDDINEVIKHNDSSISGSDEDGQIPTVFSTLKLSYTDITLGENNSIPTLQFLEVGKALKPLLDAIGSSVSLVEGDMGGNVKKLMKSYEKSPTQCQTVQDMLTFDIKMGRANEDECSVVSLMWLKRAFEFIRRLMNYIANGAEPYDAAKAAYEEVLSKHHGFLINYTFKLGINLLPYRDTFLKKLIINKSDLARPGWESQLTADMKQYFLGMENILRILTDFFSENNLEN